MLTDAQLFACGAFADYESYYAPPAVEVRETAPRRLRPPTSDVEATRSRLALLLGDAPPVPVPPIVTVFAIDGRVPAADRVARIKAELRRAPSAVIAEWQRHGGRIDVVPGPHVASHPDAGSLRARHPDACGWFSLPRRLIAIAADCRDGTALHELGHWHDRAWWSGRFSSLPEWRRICQGRAATAIRFSDCEHYAEDFALFYLGSETRANMPPEARRFIVETTG